MAFIDWSDEYTVNDEVINSQGSATLIYEIMDLLTDWLRHHVATLDKKAFSS